MARLFGRRKPLHERLLEEGGLAGSPPAETPATTTPAATRPTPPGHDIHGIARGREWDAVTTVDAPGLMGDEFLFDVLPDGTLLLEAEAEEKPPTALVDAVERELKPPYRARAVRQAGELWAVAARTIEAVRLPGRAGDTLELTVRDGERRLTVDGIPEFGSIPELETLGGSSHRDYVVRAERLDEDWWEARVDAL